MVYVLRKDKDVLDSKVRFERIREEVWVARFGSLEGSEFGCET